MSFNNNNPTIVYADNPNQITDAAIYLSNGMIIDYHVYKQQNKIKQIGEVKRTSDPSIMAIMSNNGALLGEFKLPSGPAVYYGTGNAPNTGGINMYSGSINTPNNNNVLGGINMTGNDLSIGNSNFGGISIGGNSTVVTETIKTPTVTLAPAEEKKPKKLTMLPGFEFFPIPTFYTDVEMIDIGGYGKYNITIKKDENMDIEKNNNVYAGLKSEAVKEASLLGLVECPSLDVDSRVSIMTAINIAETFKNKTIMFSGYSHASSLHSIHKKDNAIKGDDIRVMSDDNGSMFVNLLVDYVATANTYPPAERLGELLRSIDSHILSKPSGLMMKNKIVEIFNEEFKIVQNKISFNASNVKSLYKTYTDLCTLLNEKISDLSILEQYDNAKQKIYDRLTNKKSLSMFGQVSIISLGEPKDVVVTGAGFTEDILCISTRDTNILSELSTLLENEADTKTYKVDINTPNTKRLLEDCFNSNIRFEKNINEEFDINKYSTNNYQMVLYVLGSKFKVYRKRDGCYIYRSL